MLLSDKAKLAISANLIYSKKMKLLAQYDENIGSF